MRRCRSIQSEAAACTPRDFAGANGATAPARSRRRSPVRACGRSAPARRFRHWCADISPSAVVSAASAMISGSMPAERPSAQASLWLSTAVRRFSSLTSASMSLTLCSMLIFHPFKPIRRYRTNLSCPFNVPLSFLAQRSAAMCAGIAEKVNAGLIAVARGDVARQRLAFLHVAADRFGRRGGAVRIGRLEGAVAAVEAGDELGAPLRRRDFRRRAAFPSPRASWSPFSPQRLRRKCSEPSTSASRISPASNGASAARAGRASGTSGDQQKRRNRRGTPHKPLCRNNLSALQGDSSDRRSPADALAVRLWPPAVRGATSRTESVVGSCSISAR